jgi:hypothetical protein
MSTATADARRDAEVIATWLSTTRFAVSDESRLQAGITQLFTSRCIPFAREVRLSPEDRIDFLVVDRIGVECKVDGSPTAVVQQVLRYLQHPPLTALILLTSRLRLGNGLPSELEVTHPDGSRVLKPLLVVGLWRGGL